MEQCTCSLMARQSTIDKKIDLSFRSPYSLLSTSLVHLHMHVPTLNQENEEIKLKSAYFKVVINKTKP